MKRNKKLVEIINELDIPGMEARYDECERDFILEIEPREGFSGFYERFDTLEELSRVLNSRDKQEDSNLLDEIDQTICQAAREKGLLF